MKASVGDRIIVASTRLDGPVRDGRIVEVRHADGSPPYLVEWADNAQQVLVFPGPDAHVETAVPAGTAPAAAGGAPERHIRSWQVRIDLFESGGETNAHAVLITDAPQHLDARGHAHRKSGDPDVPEIGDEIAVARALRGLSERLLGTAADDISAMEGRPVSLPG
jgi:hypothetical protein